MTDPSNTPFVGSLQLGKRPALVLIDFCRAYFDVKAPFYLGSDSCLKSASKLLQEARRQHIPIFHTRVNFTPGSADGGVFMKKVPMLEVFTEGNPFAELMPEVQPLPNEPVIVKQYASAFFGTSLASTLHSLSVDTVVIAGVSTSGCVRASAVDAMQHAFIPVVVRDAVGDRGESRHEGNLFDIQAKYGEVIDEERALAYLRTTDHHHIESEDGAVK